MGPLKGIRIVEMGAIGPVPFAGMVLSDLGADVVRIDRKAKSYWIERSPAGPAPTSMRNQF